MTDNDYRIEDRFEKGRPNYAMSWLFVNLGMTLARPGEC